MEPRELYETTRATLERARWTAGAWREVLGSAIELARDLSTREDLGSILAVDSSAWDNLRAEARREWVQLRDYYNALSELEDSDEVGQESNELFLRGVQRVYLTMAGFEEGTRHMLNALSRIAPDIVEQARTYVQQGRSWWASNAWWVLPVGGTLGLAWVVRSFRGR